MTAQSAREELERYFDHVVDIGGVAPDAILCVMDTPSHSFRIVVAPLDEEPLGRIVTLAARDSYEPSLASNMIGMARSHWNHLAGRMTVVHGMQHERFDGLLLVNRTVQPTLRHISAQLDERAIAGFPIHSCELTGEEDVEEFEMIRHSGLSIVDWSRHPYPKVYMSVDNPRTEVLDAGVRSLSKFSMVCHEARQLEPDGVGVLGVENVGGIVHTIRRRDEFYVMIDGEGQQRSVPTGEIDVEIWRFLSGGGLPLPPGDNL